jgi:hypothetical protein
MVYADSLPASPSSGGPLTSSQIAQAVLGSEAPSSLYLSHSNISEIPDNAIQQLAQLRSVDDDENDGTILRSVTSHRPANKGWANPFFLLLIITWIPELH